MRVTTAQLYILSITNHNLFLWLVVGIAIGSDAEMELTKAGSPLCGPGRSWSHSFALRVRSPLADLDTELRISALPQLMSQKEWTCISLPFPLQILRPRNLTLVHRIPLLQAYMPPQPSNESEDSYDPHGTAQTAGSKQSRPPKRKRVACKECRQAKVGAHLVISLFNGFVRKYVQTLSLNPMNTFTGYLSTIVQSPWCNTGS